MKTARTLKITLMIVLSFLALSCSKKEKTVYAGNHGDDLSIENIKETIKIEKIEEEKRMRAEEAARIAEEEAKKQAILDEAARIENEKREKQLAIEREAARLKDLADRTEAQKQAFKKYRGTRYDELRLLNGKVLTGVMVSSVTPVKVTFVHEDGVSNVKFKDLPTEVREACNFDEELRQIELDRISAEGKK